MSMKMNRSIAVLLCAAAIAACEKNAVQDLTAPLPGASIKFFNFGVGAPAVNFYADDRKMTAILTTLCANTPIPPVTANDTACVTTGRPATTGVTYGNVGSGGYYAGIEPGQYTVSGRVAVATDQGTAISNVPVTIQSGNRYSFYQSGLYDAVAKTVDGFIIEDNFPAERDYSVAYVRFVNAIFNADPMILYATDRETLEEFTVGGEVAYKAGGEFVALPNGTYDLSTRYAGQATNVIVRTSVPFVAGRVYTITAFGDMTIATGTGRPLLDNTINR
jgi:hypothetical protein